ncbi:MAG: AMP-binding protein [Deltaproteobacteria bacterium]|nr:AMP-binding protein [Deltaproteobacteria bacterium]
MGRLNNDTRLKGKGMDKKAVSKNNHYFLKELETLSADALKHLQFEKTRQTLERAYHKSDFYRQRFDEAGVKPEDFKDLEDIRRFPFIDKQDLIKDQERHPPFGSRVCVDSQKIRRVNLTSGTSGMGQEVHCHEEASIRAANESTACHFAAISLKPGDLSAVLYPLGTMTGGMLSYEALRLFGATPLALAVFNTGQKIDIMKRFDVHHILTTPAYLSRITAICLEQGLNPGKTFSRLKGITVSTEPFPVAWALKMEEIWQTVIHDIYGSTQLNLNYAVTCKYGAVPDGNLGVYHLADYFALVEVLDKDTDQPVDYGEWGEPVVTTFSRQAMPLVRFRSNDRVRMLPPDLCDCGRTSRALWEVGSVSRFDDMIKIKATNVWPQTVDEAVFSFDEIEEYNGRVYIDQNGQEIARISLEFKKTAPDDSAKTAILHQLAAKIKEMTQVSMVCEEVPYGTLPRFEYKVRRWTDARIEGLDRIKYIEKE